MLTKKYLARALCISLLTWYALGFGPMIARADTAPGGKCPHRTGEIINETFAELGYNRNNSATHIYRWQQTIEYRCIECGEMVTVTTEESGAEPHVWNVTNGNTCAYCGASNPCRHAHASKIESSGTLTDHVDNKNGTHRVTVEDASYWFCGDCFATWGYQTSRHVENFPHSWKEMSDTGPLRCEECGSTGVNDCKHPQGHMRPQVVQFYKNIVNNGDGTHNAEFCEESYLLCDICFTSSVSSETVVRRIVAEPHMFEKGSIFCAVCGAGKSESAAIPVGSATLKNPLGKLAVYDGDKLVDYTGFGSFEGGTFYFEHGVLRDDMDGLTIINGTWYNMSRGQVNTSEGLVFFEGGTFYVKNGTLDKTKDGLVAYDGAQFVFSNGQFQPQVYGAWPDHRSGRFVYIWGGQFYPITDLVSYDGHIFYFINGYLATDFTGVVKDFKGTKFKVVGGQVY